MKTIKFVGYLFNRYYSKGPRASISYFSALCSMTLLGFIHLMQILILFDKMDLIPINTTASQLERRLIIFLVLLPFYFLMTRLFKKKEIESLKEKYDYDWDKVFSGNVWLVIYVLLSFALLIILLLLKKGGIEQP